MPGTTTDRTDTIEELAELPSAERADALVDVVVAEFRAALLMGDDEFFDTDTSFFELGLTSLLVLDVKKRLETLLGQPISANELFNYPTVDRLVTYLTDEVLADVFTETERA
jgi:acyl carrier protein